MCPWIHCTAWQMMRMQSEAPKPAGLTFTFRKFGRIDELRLYATRKQLITMQKLIDAFSVENDPTLAGVWTN